MSGSFKAAILNMPFGAVQYPSIQLGILQSVAGAQGIRVDGIYSNVMFSKTIGWELYRRISYTRAPLIGEWLFSKAAFPATRYDSAYFDHFKIQIDEILHDAGSNIEVLRQIWENRAVEFIESLSDQLLEGGYRVVCFSCTYSQNVASLALARLLKEKDPGIVTLFGGSNYDGEMGRAYMKAFPWIDIVIAGDGEETFPVVLNALKEKKDVPWVSGVLTRERLLTNKEFGRALFRGSMDDIPVPNYDDYFTAVRQYGLLEDGLKVAYLPIELSRGCWWGEKHKCKFCGLNAMGAEYRTRTKDVVLRQIETLSLKYNMTNFAGVDNILSMKHLNDLLGEIASEKYDYNFFFEVKSNLSREHIRRLRNAGVTHAQPGIESFSTHVLQIMSKGVRGLENVNTLKWFRYYGIEAGWNILFGFPGERIEDYEYMLDLIKNIHHLSPPQGFARIWLERFSPYFCNREEEGFTDLRPPETYTFIYPEELNLEEAAYYLSYKARDVITDEQFEPVRQEVKKWQDEWNSRETPPYLGYMKLLAGIRIIDGRTDAENPKTYFYRKPMSDIYLFCSDMPKSFASISKMLADNLGYLPERKDVLALLDRFKERGFMASEGDVYLSLAMPYYYEL